MKAEAYRILADVAERIERDGFTEELIANATERLQALLVDTDEGMRSFGESLLQLTDMCIAVAPPDTAAELVTVRATMQEEFDEALRPRSVRQRYDDVVARYARELAAKGGFDEPCFDRTISELDALVVTPEDAASIGPGLIRFGAVTAASAWLETVDLGSAQSTPGLELARRAAVAALVDGYDDESFTAVSAAFEGLPMQTHADREDALKCVELFLGVCLLADPDDATEGSGELVDAIMALSLQLAEPADPSSEAEQRYGQILADLSATLEREGFSEHALANATGQMKALDVEAPEIEVIPRGLVAVVDTCLPHAPADTGEMLMVLRDFVQEDHAEALEAPSLATAEVVIRADEIVSTLRASLEAGTALAPAWMLAWTDLQRLGFRIGTDDQEAMIGAMKAMGRALDAIGPYAGTEHDYDFLAARKLFQDAISLVENFDPKDESESAMEQTQMQDSIDRFSQAFDPDLTTPESADTAPYVRQYLDLFRPFNDRIQSMSMREDLGTRDKADFDRLEKRNNDIGELMRGATEEHLLDHQRGGLRGMALDLRRFERRKHLMVIYPEFPKGRSAQEPNCIFFSGSKAVGAHVDTAMELIRMHKPGRRTAGGRVHARWQQLRQAGVAVFDYTTYDPVGSDPPNPASASPEAEAEAMRAAGSVAEVAYETGIAYVLGTPMVVVTRQGRPAPFDIDIEPVELEDDERDVERLIGGVQTAQYGAQRSIGGSCLAQTVQFVRERYASDEDPTIAALLDGLTDTEDAEAVRLTVATVIDLKGDGGLLVHPFLPGDYPAAGKPRLVLTGEKQATERLFHISGFRDWAEAATDVVRAACLRANVAYRIGSARLNPDIVGSIWDDICRASLVVADITNLNPNAVLELGVAHALGRPTLIVTQNRRPHAYLPAIDKVRTQFYDPVHGRAALASAVDRFIAGERD